MATVDLSGLGRLEQKLRRLGQLDAPLVVPLMERFEDIITEDNRKGILSGLDKDGNPLVSVTYRPADNTPKAVGARRGGNFGSTAGRFKGETKRTVFRHSEVYGAKVKPPPGAPNVLVRILPNNNLTTKQYQKLTGPPLAPRREQSRVIANLKTAHMEEANGTWVAIGIWDQVLDVKGRKFLPRAFVLRPLAGVRPWGIDQARKAVRAWARELFKRI